MNFSGDTTLSHLIRTRPRSVEILEELTGSRYLNNAEDRITDFCKKEDLEEADLLNRFSHLGHVPPDSNWKTKPLCHLIDFLTENHREFRGKDLPAIRALFACQIIPPNLNGYLFRLIYQKFCAFEEELLWHMNEEEVYLFPKILKTEACYMHPDLVPDRHIGLERFFLPAQLESPEEKLKHMITIILDNIWDQIMLEPATSLASEIYSKVESLKAKLVLHANLELEVLFPQAIGLEKDLFVRIDRGQSAPTP